MEINLNNLLLNLENLRQKPGFDEEDRALMKQFEIEVANYEALLAAKQNPWVVKLLQLFRDEIKDIDMWVLNNAKNLMLNPEMQREGLYRQAKRETLVAFVEHFDRNPVEAIEHIQKRVNQFIKN